MNTIDEIIEITTAFRNGNIVQVSLRDGWKDSINPAWQFTAYDYRVKPEPMVFYVNIYPERKNDCIHQSKEEALKWVGRDCVRTIKVVESIED